MTDDFTEVVIRLGSHSHGDHREGDGWAVKLTGARAMAMAEDIPPLQAMGFAQKLVEMDIPLLSKEGKFAKRTGWLVKPRSHLMMIAERTLLKS